jgi:hypothetical protein
MSSPSAKTIAPATPPPPVMSRLPLAMPCSLRVPRTHPPLSAPTSPM